MTVTLGAKAGMVAEPQSRRKRGSLSTGEIVMASMRVLDTEGPAALTFNRLGKELRSSPTAVYRHYSSRQEILLAVAEHLDFLSLDKYSPTDDWRNDLTQLACESRGAGGARLRALPLFARQPPHPLHGPF